MNLAPLLGERYNDWLPLMIMIFSLIFLLNLHGRLAKFLRIAGFFNYAVATPETVREGKELISTGLLIYLDCSCI